VARNRGFRGWFYFRNGWSLYFAFIFAAINTLTVTYYLAIEKYPDLNWLFPTFFHYIAIVCSAGIPLLILVGYVHYKRTAARKAEVDISYETDAYKARTLVNTEISMKLNLKLIDIVMKLSNNEKIPDNDYDEIKKLYADLSKFTNDRTFRNKMDLKFLRDTD
jgi:hypothetical protein|tara:strand:- start:21897 stop:22385 length:489 start_codon:yes stop_codon:yes gene_type:complete